MKSDLFKMVYTSWSRFIFQPLHSLGECHCWWTRESFRAHAAKFYGPLQLIRSVLRASTFSVLKFIEIVIFGVYLPFRLASVCFGTFVISLFNYFSTIIFQLLKLHCLAKDHWRGFSTRNAHMVHIVNLIRLKMVYTSWWKSLFELATLFG